MVFEKAVEFLISSGARVDLCNEHGQGIFLLVAERDWGYVADMIAKRALATTPEVYSVSLLTATYYGNEKQVSNLLDQTKEAPSKCTNFEEMALFLAVERDFPDVVQILLSAGVDVDAKDSIGQTSLHRATRRGSARLIRTLFRNGAKVDIMNDDGRTAWSANISSKNERILQILLDEGADPNTRGHNGVSELYSAAAGGNTEVVKLMLKSGTDPSIKTAFDWAPLHWAAYCGHDECVKLLIDAGADLNQASDQDKTPLDLAISTCQSTIIDFLTASGAKKREDIVAATSNTNIKRVGTAITFDNKGRNSAKLMMTFDQPLGQSFTFGQFIYITDDRTSNRFLPYQLSKPLNCAAPSIAVKHCQTRPEMGAYPLNPEMFSPSDILYNIVPLGSDYLDFRLRCTSETAFIGSIRVRKVWTGSWVAQIEHESSRSSLFRTTPDWSRAQSSCCRWTAEDGRLLARTTESTISFEQGIDCSLLDALVTCWVAKLWSETLAHNNFSINC
jgi:ankyrin repeat protein